MNKESKAETIRRMLISDCTYAEITKATGAAPSTISHHSKSLGIKRFVPKVHDWVEVRNYYDSGHSCKECKSKFGIGNSAWYSAIKRGDINPRPRGANLDTVLLNGRIYSSSALKRRLIKEGVLENKCLWCGIHTWRGRELVLQLDHVNGDSSDNRRENLRLLCPNCHSQTETFCGKNNKGRT
jgi:DNA-binding transcriptional ArsR family regulator